MSEPRGLHPETGHQRARRGRDWAEPGPGAEVVTRDAPFGAVGKGLAALGLGLAATIALVLAFTGLALPRPEWGADAAHAHFRTAAPPLLHAPAQALRRERQGHPAPTAARLDRAMDRVIAQGWGDAPPPGRAEVAIARARAGQ
jgi:hypothetical protein